MVKLAVVGLGWWGKTLVDAVQGKSPDIRFVAGATRTRAKAEGYAAERGFRLLDSYAEVLADPEVEGVVLATPHLDHEAQIVAAAEAGKHVFVEKPFTMTAAGARRAVAAVEKAGVVVGLGHNRRFHPNMTELRERMRAGALGTVLHAEATMTGPSGLFMPADSWRADAAQSPVGGMAPMGIHMLDGLIDLMGPIAEVICQSVHRAAPAGVLDTTGILMTFESGATGYLSCMIATAPSYRMAVYGNRGVAEIRKPLLDLFGFQPAPEAQGRPPGPAEEIARPGVDTVALELEAFAAAVAGKAPFAITPEEMVHGIAAYEAIIASATDRCPRKVQG